MSLPESPSRRSFLRSSSSRRSSCSTIQDIKQPNGRKHNRRSTFRLSRSILEPPVPKTNRVSHEIVLLILDHFATTYEDPSIKRFSDRRTLVACSRVSRFWNVHANKLLYQWAEMTSFAQCAQFRRTCTRRPHLGGMVKALTLPETWANCLFATGNRQQKMAYANIELAAELMHSLPNLETFKLSTTQRVPFNLYASYFDDENYAPFKMLKHLCITHQACYDFTVRAPLPWHMDFSNLESLALSRFVIWHDDVWPMTWPHLPALRHLTLEECFLDGEELAHLLSQVSDTIRSIHLCRSLFSISIMSDGLGVVADSLEELVISEHWGFEDMPATFTHFSALKTLKLESHNCRPSVYTRLPPNLEKLAISASEDGVVGSRVLEEVLGFLQTEIHTYLPSFRGLEIKAGSDQFGTWADHVQDLCAAQGLTLDLDLIDHQPLAHTPCRDRRRPILDTFSWTLKGLKAIKHFVVPQ